MLELSITSMSVLLKDSSIALFVKSTLLVYLLLSSICVIKLENTMCVLGLKDFLVLQDVVIIRLSHFLIQLMSGPLYHNE